MNTRLLSAQALVVFLVVLYLLTGCIKYIPECDKTQSSFSYDSCFAATQSGR